MSSIYLFVVRFLIFLPRITLCAPPSGFWRSVDSYFITLRFDCHFLGFFLSVDSMDIILDSQKPI